MKIEMFATMDKAKPDTGRITGLDLAVAKHSTVRVTGLPLWRKLLKIRYNLLYCAWTDRGILCIVHSFVDKF
jgi:hypothetical protein